MCKSQSFSEAIYARFWKSSSAIFAIKVLQKNHTKIKSIAFQNDADRKRQTQLFRDCRGVYSHWCKVHIQVTVRPIELVNPGIPFFQIILPWEIQTSILLLLENDEHFKSAAPTIFNWKPSRCDGLAPSPPRSPTLSSPSPSPTTSSLLGFARMTLFFTDGLVVSERSAVVKALADWWAWWML